MKTKLLIAAMCVWMALPHNQTLAADTRILQSACQKCGGDVHYIEGATEGECDVCHEKLALVLLMIGGCLCVLAGGCYVAAKLKKMNGTNGVFNSGRRFGTNLNSALSSTNSFVAISGEASDVPYLLSLATATNSSGRYVLEQSANMIDWVELGRYADEDFLAVHESPMAGAFYRVRVDP